MKYLSSRFGQAVLIATVFTSACVVTPADDEETVDSDDDAAGDDDGKGSKKADAADDDAADDDAADDDAADDDAADDDAADDDAADDDAADDDAADDDAADDDAADDDAADDDAADDDAADDDAADDDAADDDAADDDAADDDAADDDAADDDAGTEGDLNSCGERDTTGALEVGAAVLRGDTTWSGVVHIVEDLLIGEGELTIEPGTTIIVAADVNVDVGFAGAEAAVYAEGTAEAPIRFCGESAEAGFWNGLSFRDSVTSDSVLSHVVVDGAGSVGSAVELNGDINIDTLLVRNSGGDGLRAADFEPLSTGLSVEGAAGVAVTLTGPGAIDNFPLGGVFTNNEDNYIELDLGSLDEDVVFSDIGIPYYLSSELLFANGEYEILAGVEWVAGPDVNLEFGWAGGETSIKMMGTEADPIVFRGRNAVPGYWMGLYMHDDVLSDSVLNFVEIHDAGGSGNSALVTYTALELHDVSLFDNEGGAFISANGLDADSANLNITGTVDTPLVVEAGGIASLPRGGDFSGNGDNYIAITDGSYDRTGSLPDLGIPYRLMDELLLGSASLTIEPGVTILMSADTGFSVGFGGGDAELIVAGTAANPVRIIGFDEEPGYWGTIDVGDSALSTSSFSWVEIGHGGSGTASGAALTLRRAVSVSNCTIFESSGYAIDATDDDDTTNYADGNTFMDNVTGDIAPD